MKTTLPVLLLLVTCCPVVFLSAQQAETPAAEAPTVPWFKDGLAQKVEGFSNPDDWIREQLFVETEFDSDDDGSPDRMYVMVCRQKQTDTEGLKVPAVYVTSPYFAGTGGTGPNDMWDPRQELGADPPERGDPSSIKPRPPRFSERHAQRWVPLGYAVVCSCSPGTGLSEGCPTVGGDNESLAPKAVIDWLCGRARGFTTVDGDEPVTADWCTGKVGMTGTSYNGTLPLAAATTGVEGLEAIIPIAPNTSYYHYYRSNGLVRHPGGYTGEDIDVLYNFINSGDPETREFCDCNIRDELMVGQFDRKNGDYNDFWASRDYLNDLQPLQAALLMAHAFNDWNVMPEHSVRIYQAVKARGVPCQIYFHQGGHGGPPPLDMMNRWFTRYLFGIENGVEEDPRSWIVREDAGPEDGPTAYPEYPHPQARLVTLYPGKGGQQSGRLRWEPWPEAQGSEVLTDDYSIKGSDHAQAETSVHRLLYATPPLTAPLHISGLPRLKIRLASSKPAANLSVWLVSLPWESGKKITDNLITRGWADPQNYRSLRESEPLVPGQFYELSFDLQPDDQVIPAGQQVGLMIFSSDYDFTLWPKPGTELTIDLDATRLTLPVVGGKAALAEATARQP
jgi:X-Pro dipeptidyl-peptidase